MATSLDDDDEQDGEREARIEELKRQANRIAGGQMRGWESDLLSLEQRQEFWRRVVEFESAQTTDLAKELTAAGVALPEPDGLADPELTAKLWEVLEALGRMRVFITETDHLSDRELYTHLWRAVLPEEMTARDLDPRSACHIPILCTGSEEHNRLYLKYYADDTFRKWWLTDFPDYDMPPHEDPPYDRDQHLPQWDGGRPPAGGPDDVM